jgi:hypothetical protein
VAMFLNIVGHNQRNRLVGTNYERSGETVSRYFNNVLHAIGELRTEFIRPPHCKLRPKLPKTIDGIIILWCEVYPYLRFTFKLCSLVLAQLIFTLLNIN